MNNKIDTIIPSLRIARIRRKFLELLANLHIEDVHAIDSERLMDHRSTWNLPLVELWELEAVVERTRGNRRFLELYSMVEFAIYESAFLKKLLLTSANKTEVNQLTKEDLKKPIYIERTRDSVAKNTDNDHKKLFIKVKNAIGTHSDKDGWVEFLQKNELQIYNFFDNNKKELLESLSLRDFKLLWRADDFHTHDSTGFHFKELKNYIDAMQEIESIDGFDYTQIKSILLNGNTVKVLETITYLEPLRQIRNCLIHDFGWPKRKLEFFDEIYDIGSDIFLPFNSKSKHYVVLVNTFLIAYHWYFALIRKIEGGDDPIPWDDLL